MMEHDRLTAATSPEGAPVPDLPGQGIEFVASVVGAVTTRAVENYSGRQSEEEDTMADARRYAPRRFQYAPDNTRRVVNPAVPDMILIKTDTPTIGKDGLTTLLDQKVPIRSRRPA